MSDVCILAGIYNIAHSCEEYAYKIWFHYHWYWVHDYNNNDNQMLEERGCCAYAGGHHSSMQEQLEWKRNKHGCHNEFIVE